jgi:hypothetical protein
MIPEAVKAVKAECAAGGRAGGQAVKNVEEKEILQLKPASLRKRLFRKSKPAVRKYQPEDLGWLWAAYKHGSFENLPEMDEKAFREFVEKNVLPRYYEIDIIEDDNESFRSKHGPVALVTTFYDGWRMEPHVDWFKWATPRNILRGTIFFLQKARWRQDVGVIVVRSLQDTKNLFTHAEKYEVVHYRGCVPYGDPRGNEYIFSSKGNQRKEKT